MPAHRYVDENAMLAAKRSAGGAPKVMSGNV